LNLAKQMKLKWWCSPRYGLCAH